MQDSVKFKIKSDRFRPCILIENRRVSPCNSPLEKVVADVPHSVTVVVAMIRETV